ncbi:MAG: aminotransferase class V-fold PLP-dependent enzyme, partial [Desulfobacterales bacterium]|nr:aminotransferase class V-fold PLP-dependent enzyme [Desulfobacterales bacterium]
MNIKEIPPNPYLLLTPGPLTTTPTVRAALLRDWCTWDGDYKTLVQDIRAQLTALATPAPGYTSVLMQGSGTFCVESTLTTALPPEGKLLVLANGAYGRRMAEIARRCRLPHTLLDFGDLAPPDPHTVDRALEKDPAITHLALVHCETTTGMLNPLDPIAHVARARGIRLILDAMSSFGGIPLDMAELGV